MTLERHFAAHRVEQGIPNGFICTCGEHIHFRTGQLAWEARDSHLAATWREARTVRTVDELDALHRDAQVMWVNPDGTIRCTTYPDNGALRELVASGMTARVAWTPEDGAL